MSSSGRFDLTMSRRTRRPSMVFSFTPDESFRHEEEDHKHKDHTHKDTTKEKNFKQEIQINDAHHKSLKDLMKDGSKVEDNHLQLAVVSGGTKSSGKLSLYAKVLNHFAKLPKIKTRSKKKSVPVFIR